MRAPSTSTTSSSTCRRSSMARRVRCCCGAATPSRSSFARARPRAPTASARSTWSARRERASRASSSTAAIAAISADRSATMPPLLRWLRDVTRDGAARLLWQVGATRPGRALAGRLTIVTFHRVLPPDRRARYPLPHLAVPPDLFGELLRCFSADFECLPLADAVAAAATRDGASARPLLAVTFDDGLRDNFEFARPLLKRHGVRATFFAVAGHARSGELLWHDRLAYAAAHASGAPPEEMRRRLLELLPAAELDELLRGAG